MKSDDRQNEEPKDGVRDAAEEERMIRIMQYCDGVLPAREAALVADEIARDPEAARLASEMSAGANAARAAWGSIDLGPVPFELARRVTQSAREPVRSQRAAVSIDWRMAASLVVGIALGMLALLIAQHGGDQGLRLAGSDKLQNEALVLRSEWQPALMSALAKDPETASVVFNDASGGDNAVRVARWFDTAAGLRCAEFAKSTSGAVTAGGIACRKPDGGWDVIEQAR
jgi:anti-sigma factor RsiW